MSKRKPFGETKVGKLLKTVGSPAADLLANVIPGASIISNLIDTITKDQKIPSVDKNIILKELNTELELANIEVADRANASNREIELKKAGGSNWFQYIDGIFVLIGYAAVIYVVLFEDVADKELFYFIA